MFREFQNLRQQDQSIQSYTNQFMRLQIRTDLPESKEQATTRYVNGLSFQLQDELALVKLPMVDEAYEYALKVEEKLNQKSKMNKRGDSSQNSGTGISSKSANQNSGRGCSSKLAKEEELEGSTMTSVEEEIKEVGEGGDNILKNGSP